MGAAFGRGRATAEVEGRQAVAVLERPFMPEGDFDRLFAVVRHSGAPVVKLTEVDDSEPCLSLGMRVSTPAHLGSQHLRRLTVYAVSLLFCLRVVL